MRGLSLVGAALLCCALPAAGQAQQQVPLQQRVVASGRPTPIMPVMFLSPDCKSMGVGDIAINEGPRGGRVTVENAKDYPSFQPTNPRSACNKLKVPSQRIIYTSAPGFVGEDDVAIEMVGPFGVAQRIRFHIVVR